MNRKEMQKEALKQAQIPSDNNYLQSLRAIANLLIDCKACILDGETWTYKVCYDKDTCENCPTKDECRSDICLLCMFADEFYAEKCHNELLFLHKVQVVRFKKTIFNSL